MFERRCETCWHFANPPCQEHWRRWCSRKYEAPKWIPPSRDLKAVAASLELLLPALAATLVCASEDKEKGRRCSSCDGVSRWVVETIRAVIATITSPKESCEHGHTPRDHMDRFRDEGCDICDDPGPIAARFLERVAPELLAICKEVLHLSETGWTACPCVLSDRLRKAVRKAEHGDA